MAINQNRNSIRVLRTTAVGHLVHENIPDLSIGTGDDFTIQLWVVKGKDTDGVLYSQEGGFSIQLVDGQVVFSLDGFATLSSGADWKVSAHRQDYIAVRYQSGNLALFIGGLKIAEKSVSTKTSPCAGNFAIGKQFTGGFALIRVSKTARSDQELLSDNAMQPAVDSHCVFQSDCSAVQYRDVSANHLPMWAEGEGAGCGIYTACTVFDGAGQVSCTPLEALNATHTLLLKLWPQDEQKAQCLYTAMDGTKTMYAVELTPQSDHTFQLSVVNGSGGKATMSKTLLPELWQDVAAVFDGGKVTLYLDGALDGTYPFSFSGSRSEVLVGAEYESGRPIYDKGFCGYMAYTAEFGKALSAADIALYADDPPFMFEDGLTSLLPLDWPNEVEAVGATALSVIGSAPFNMVADSTPRDGDIGCSMRVPTEVSPEWDKLSAEEQWTMELLGKLILEALTDLCGYPSSAAGADGDTPLWQRTTRSSRRHNHDLYEQLQTTPPNDPNPADTAEQLTRTIGGRGNTPFGQWLAGLFGGGATTTAGNGATYTSSNAGLIIGMSLGIAMTAAMVITILVAQDERPSQDSELTIDSVCWDHQGDPTQGGIHYHKGGAKLPATMDDAPGPIHLETTCVLVPGKLQKPTLDVTLSLSDLAQTTKTGTLKAYDLTSGGLLGDQSVSYTIAPATCVIVHLPFNTDKLPKDGVHKLTHIWQFWDGDTFLLNCVCTLYLLPSLPIAPWVVNSGTTYNPDVEGYVRLEFLDFFLPSGEQPADFAAWAVQRLNSSGFVYDTTGGGDCHYTDFYRHIFYLGRFLNDVGQPNKKLNCCDCAHIVSTACALVGNDLPLVKFKSTGGRQGFDCNRVIVIGTTDWRYPFDATGTKRRGGFSYHMFNAKLAKNAKPTKDTPLYDACLKVDGGDYPGDGGPAGAQKVQVLPTGMPARDGDAKQVKVPVAVPYTKNCYRERLVHNDHYCDFQPGYVVRVASIDVVSVVRALPPDPFIADVMDAFSLAPTPEQEAAFAARRSGSWTPKALPGAVLTWSGPDHDRWELVADGQVCQVRHWRCDTAQEAAWRMAAQVAAYTHPDKRPGMELDVEVGERCVVVAASQIVFCRQGHVFTVGAESLDAALTAAKALDESVQAG